MGDLLKTTGRIDLAVPFKNAGSDDITFSLPVDDKDSTLATRGSSVAVVPPRNPIRKDVPAR
jgi:hypothetical protein